MRVCETMNCATSGRIEWAKQSCLRVTKQLPLDASQQQRHPMVSQLTITPPSTHSNTFCHTCVSFDVQLVTCGAVDEHSDCTPVMGQVQERSRLPHGIPPEQRSQGVAIAATAPDLMTAPLSLPVHIEVPSADGVHTVMLCWMG